MSIITSTKDLETLCIDLRASSFVTVDTEFLRDKTYELSPKPIAPGTLGFEFE